MAKYSPNVLSFTLGWKIRPLHQNPAVLDLFSLLFQSLLFLVLCWRWCYCCKPFCLLILTCVSENLISQRASYHFWLKTTPLLLSQASVFTVSLFSLLSFSSSSYSSVYLTDSSFLSCCSFPQPLALTPSLSLTCVCPCLCFLNVSFHSCCLSLPLAL